MRKPVIVTTLLVAGIFGTGYVLGQVAGVSASLAATHNRATVKAAPRQSSAPAGVRHADGQITAVGTDTITIAPDADQAGSTEYTGVTTINLTGSTKYGDGSAATATRPAFTAGQYIIAEGTVSADGKTLTATLVSAHTGGPGRGGPGHASGPHADGTVAAVNGNTITVTADADQAGTTEYSAVTTIILTSTTQYDAGHDSAGTTTKPTITAGQHIVAEGTLSSDGKTLTATQVSVDTGGPGGH